ncbi:hypothetical protein HBI17_180490 [Parastagonospora nodorum]|nr:hypothetical protein HBI17_180490 [Parastagonospora nodorum]
MHPITRSYESAKNAMTSCTLAVAGQRMVCDQPSWILSSKCCEVSVVERWCDNVQKIFQKWYVSPTCALCRLLKARAVLVKVCSRQSTACMRQAKTATISSNTTNLMWFHRLYFILELYWPRKTWLSCGRMGFSTNVTERWNIQPCQPDDRAGDSKEMGWADRLPAAPQRLVQRIAVA